MAIKQTKIIFFVTITGGLVNILLNYLLIPKYSIVGASIATGISLILMAIIRFIFSIQKTKTFPQPKENIKVVIVAIITFIISYFVFKLMNFHIIISVILTMIIFKVRAMICETEFIKRLL